MTYKIIENEKIMISRNETCTCEASTYEEAFKKTVAYRIKLIRNLCRFTQKEVAEAINIKRSTYCYYEIGKVTPSILTLVKIADFYQEDISFFTSDIKWEKES